MKRKHKQYSKPKRPYDAARIEEEVKIKKEYGLKNKREIWKADAKVRVMRQKAKRLIKATKDEQEALFKRLQKMGLDVSSISDVLGLDKTDYLSRRLQTVIFKKRIASTVKSARQMITHKKIIVNGNVVDSPSYIVPVSYEEKIEVKTKKPSAKPVEAAESKE